LENVEVRTSAIQLQGSYYTCFLYALRAVIECVKEEVEKGCSLFQKLIEMNPKEKDVIFKRLAHEFKSVDIKLQSYPPDRGDFFYFPPLIFKMAERGVYVQYAKNQFGAQVLMKRHGQTTLKAHFEKHVSNDLGHIFSTYMLKKASKLILDVLIKNTAVIQVLPQPVSEKKHPRDEEQQASEEKRAKP
jgi:hypothetical protein